MTTSNAQATAPVNTSAAPEVAAPAAAKPAAKQVEKSFENKTDGNPMASAVTPKKSLEQKIRDLAEASEAKKAAAAKRKPAPKTSAIVNPDDTRSGGEIQDASATAGNKPKPQPKQAAPEQEAIEPVESSGVVGDAVVEETPAAPEWEPNYGFKTSKLDPQGNRVETEMDIPEKFRSLITDKESEHEIKTLFSKAEGIEFSQKRQEQFKAEKEQAANYIAQVHQRLSGVQAQIESGDLDSAFQTMAIPQEKILQWVLDKVNYQQLPVDQRQLIDGQREAQKRAQSLEEQNKALSQAHMNAMVQHKSMALDATLNRPDLKAVINAYDSRQGKQPQDPPFRDLVIRYGDYSWKSSGGKVDLSPSDCVEAVLREYGIAQGYAQAQSQNPAQVQSNAPAQQAQPTRQTPSLPNVAGRAASPTAPRITTKAQLLAHRKQILGL